MADIPGLIKGAHKGQGLGTRFLKHIERTRILLHLIDISDQSDENIEKNFKIILDELTSFNRKVAEKPTIVVASKIDAVSNIQRLASLRTFCSKTNQTLFEISSQTGQGLPELKEGIWGKLQDISKETELIEREISDFNPDEKRPPEGR